MGRKIIVAELRKGIDDDIVVALQEAEKQFNRSDIIRSALRQYLLGEETLLTIIRSKPTRLNKPKHQVREIEGPIKLNKAEVDPTKAIEKLDNLLNSY